MGTCRAVVLALLVASCAPRDAVLDTARQSGLTPRTIETPGFRLAAWERLPLDPGGRLTVYVEGDGMAWLSRSQPSSDPTPRDPVALALASADPSAAVLYLARPCQFAGRADPKCDTRYWTHARFAPEVVESTAWAVAWALRATQARSLHLVGYSGGGTLAALLAARHLAERTELTTIATPLDLETWTRLLGVSPLSGSLSPRDVAAQLRTVPQRHLVGGRDETVPARLAQDWLNLVRPSCGQVRVMPGFDHTCCWARLPAAELSPLACP
ncbi:MAG: alpha/beta hydrolase [Magnetospirillum gryphiswaldense]|nr:alpha/beta hydrolase [Magnetospirillum gryphiswaldense]